LINYGIRKKWSIIEAIIKLVSIDETSISVEFSINLHHLLQGKYIRYSDPQTSPCLLLNRAFRKPAPQNYPNNPETIGEHIRKKRIDSGLSQAELAKILNMSTDCIT